MERAAVVGPLVSSYAIDDGARLLLFDPLVTPRSVRHRIDTPGHPDFIAEVERC